MPSANRSIAWVLITSAITFLLGTLQPSRAQAPAPEKRNILFLFADDMRADTIAALGNPIIKTPNLDRLAHRGLAFNRAYMQGGMQGATCVPSRAMLLSGQNLFHIDEKLMRNAIWPEAFGKAGYTTFVSGKWHNGDASLARTFQIARSMFTGGMTNPMEAKLRDVTGGKVGEAVLSPQHACAAFADETIRFLKEHKGGSFFAYLPFDAPHDPHIVPDDFPVHYEAAKIPLPPSFLPQHPWNNGEMEIRDEKLLGWPRTPDAVRAILAEYYRYISYLDSQIGRVLDALDASPFAKNTIVVFAADSGVARGSHGLVGKQNVYEYDSVRVPLIIAGPGIRANERTDAMCYLFDVLPTLGKLCGVASPNAGDGFDFQATLADPAKPARDRLMFAYRDVQRGFTDGRWKLIRYPRVDRTQLFDLQSDPHETTNLAEKPEHAARVADLMQQLEAEMRRSGDKAELKVANPKPAAWSPSASARAGNLEAAKFAGVRRQMQSFGDAAEISGAVTVPKTAPKERLSLQSEIALASFKAGVCVSANLSIGQFDSHQKNDEDQMKLIPEFLAGIAYLFHHAEELKIREKLVVVTQSEMGRTPTYNQGNGKDHWSVGSVMFIGAGIKGNRLIGASSEKQLPVPLDPQTLAIDQEKGIRLRPEDIHECLRQLAGIADHPLSKKFPLGVNPPEMLQGLWG